MPRDALSMLGDCVVFYFETLAPLLFVGFRNHSIMSERGHSSTGNAALSSSLMSVVVASLLLSMGL